MSSAAVVIGTLRVNITVYPSFFIAKFAMVSGTFFFDIILWIPLHNL